MANNKITTLSYFTKRMKESGYEIIKIFSDYSEADPRLWTVMIDPGGTSVFCTHYVNKAHLDDVYFELTDGGQYLPNRMSLKTDSMDVVCIHLNRANIINKREGYGE